MSSRRIRVGVPILAIWITLLGAGTAVAQEVPSGTEAAPESVVRRPSPRGAFARSVVLPGWGQVAYGANLRGGIYFAGYTGSWFMLVKTLKKLGEARDVETERVAAAREVVRQQLLDRAATDSVLARRFEHADSLALAVEQGVDEDESVKDIRELVSARKQQREDWITFTLVWALASGVDAFVNAHLADFPAEVDARPRADGGVEVGLKLPAGRAP